MRPILIALTLWLLVAIYPTRADASTRTVNVMREDAATAWLDLPGVHCIRFDWNRSMLSPSFQIKGWPSWSDGTQRWEVIGYTTALSASGAPWTFSLNTWMPGTIDMAYPVGINGATFYWRQDADGMWFHAEPRELPLCGLTARFYVPLSGR